MKKLIAMLLCFAMVIAFGASAAFAAMPDAKSAENAIISARTNLGRAKTQERSVKAVERAIAALKDYEAVKYNSSKTQAEVDAAYATVSQKLRDLGIYNDPDTLTTTQLAGWKASNASNAAIYKLWAAQNEVWSKYWLSKGTKMDVNERTIGLNKLVAAFNLENAQAAAASAKLGALVAQATAKALIADAVKTAQNAAATAVANAQASAYSSLSDAYANAVESFWGEVELYVLGLG